MAGVELSPTMTDFRIKNIVEAKLHRFTDDIEEICNAAVREADIEEKINTIEEEWILASLTLDEFKNRGL